MTNRVLGPRVIENRMRRNEEFANRVFELEMKSKNIVEENKFE
jgi:hypothetical protein